MLKSNLTIAGSNFIFSHINENYSEYFSKEKKLRVIFRGINLITIIQKIFQFLKEKNLNKNGIYLQTNLLYFYQEDSHIGKDKKNLSSL